MHFDILNRLGIPHDGVKPTEGQTYDIKGRVSLRCAATMTWNELFKDYNTVRSELCECIRANSLQTVL